MSRPDYTLPLDQLPDPLPIEPLSKPFDVTITPPGSKSITCRAYVLAALASGESKLIRPLRADDTDLLLKALCTLGADARWEGEDVYIKGVGGRFPRGGSVNLGDGGTPTRFMIACACLAAEPVTVDGSKRMRERPIAEGVAMLRQLGAKIEYLEAEGRLPVRVTWSELKGGRITLKRTITSQFVSAALLIGAFLPGGVAIEYADVPASESYVVLTLKVIDDWNALTTGKITGHRGRCSVKPWSVTARDYTIEPDASSAAYWLVAAAMRAGNRVIVPNISRYSNQPDVSLVGAIEDLGTITYLGPENVDLVLEGTGGYASKDRDRDVFDFSLMPDAAVAFACSAAVQSYKIRLIGLRTLRVKETDRIAALANELRKVGCTVETGEDWIEITPPAANRDLPGRPPNARATDPIVIETYNDHRMAMAFAVLGLAAPNGQRLAIRNPACVAKSYPTFWKDFAKLYE